MPYSGAPSEGIILSAHKLLAKQRLVQAGLPTPPWLALPEDEPTGLKDGPTGLDDDSSTYRLPPQTLCIVKPIKEHASVGLGDESVFRGGDRASLCEEIRRRSRRIGRVCFAEAYVEGREFNLGLLAGPAGPEVLPPAEIRFLDFPPEKPRIVGYRAKWDEASFEYRNTPRSFDFEEHQRDLLDELRRLARTCWDVFGLRGYARVDFRVDAELRPWILEVNSNPCLSPDAGFAAALERASIPLAEAVRRILDDTAVKRC